MKKTLIDRPENGEFRAVDVIEEKINCPICGMPSSCMKEENIGREETTTQSDKLIENSLTSYLCMACGYTTNSDLEFGSSALKEAIKNSPKLVTDLSVVDNERNIIWFPSVLNFPNKGVICPDGLPEDWGWIVYPSVPLTTEELEKLNENKDESSMNKYTHRIDVVHAKRFAKDEFQEALKMLNGILADNEEMNYTQNHKRNFLNEKVLAKSNLTPGAIVTFNYIDEKHNASKRMVLVLNPVWQGNLHALDIEEISVKTLQELTNVIRLWYSRKLNEILKLRLPLLKVNVGNPKTFYITTLKHLIETKVSKDGVYREFVLNKITGLKVVEYKFNLQEKIDEEKKTQKTKVNQNDMSIQKAKTTETSKK